MIYGEAGQDLIEGSGGSDSLFGGAWWVVAGVDDDYVGGDTGNDMPWGENGSDRIYGGEGRDVFGSGDGSDILYGGSGMSVGHKRQRPDVCT